MGNHDDNRELQRKARQLSRGEGIPYTEALRHLTELADKGAPIVINGVEYFKGEQVILEHPKWHRCLGTIDEFKGEPTINTLVIGTRYARVFIEDGWSITKR